MGLHGEQGFSWRDIKPEFNVELRQMADIGYSWSSASRLRYFPSDGTTSGVAVIQILVNGRALCVNSAERNRIRVSTKTKFLQLKEICNASNQ